MRVRRRHLLQFLTILILRVNAIRVYEDVDEGDNKTSIGNESKRDSIINTKDSIDILSQNIEENKQNNNTKRESDNSKWMPSSDPKMMTQKPETADKKPENNTKPDIKKDFKPSQQVDNFFEFNNYNFPEPRFPDYNPKPVKFDANMNKNKFVTGNSKFTTESSLKNELNKLPNNYPKFHELAKEKYKNFVENQKRYEYLKKQEEFNKMMAQKWKPASPEITEAKILSNYPVKSNDFFTGYNENVKFPFSPYKPGEILEFPKDYPYSFELPTYYEFKEVNPKPTINTPSSTTLAAASTTSRTGWKHQTRSPPLPVAPKHHGTSIWRNIGPIIATLVPIGILISALKPNVIRVETNTTIPNNRLGTTGSRHRSLEKFEEDLENKFPTKLINPLLLKARDINDRTTITDCEKLALCEMSTAGKLENADELQKLLWSTINKTPSQIVKNLGLENVFNASKENKCNIFSCEK